MSSLSITTQPQDITQTYNELGVYSSINVIVSPSNQNNSLSYQWYIDSNQVVAIIDATSNSYTPPSNSNVSVVRYFVIVTESDVNGQIATVTSDTITYTIEKANSSVSISIDGLSTNTFTYNGSENAPTLITTKTGSDSTTKYYYYGILSNGTAYGSSDIISNDKTETKPTNAGTYYVLAFVDTNTNYNSAQSNSISFTIEKANSSVSISIDASSTDTFEYNGLENAPILTTANSGSDSTITYYYYGTYNEITYGSSDITSNDKTETKPINTGSYCVIAYIASNLNYNSVTSDAINFTITTKQVTLNATKTYDGNKNLSETNVTIGNLVSGENLNYTSATCYYANVTDTGNYINAITLTNYLSDETTYYAFNYSLPDLTQYDATSNNVTITQKQITITATKTYDGNKNLSSVTIGSLVSGENLNYTDATCYYANVSNTNNYINAITLTYYSSGGTTYYASNYLLPSLTEYNSTNNKVTITRKQITITATKTYNGNKNITSVTIGNLILGEQLNYSNVTCYYANVSNANNYINAITLSNYSSGGNTYYASNYKLPTLDNTNAPVTINTKQVTITAIKTYDGNKNLMGYVTIGNIIFGEQLNYTDATCYYNNVTSNTNYIDAITLTNYSSGDTTYYASNYSLPSLSYHITNNKVTINTKTLTIQNPLFISKIYDGFKTTALSTDNSKNVLTGIVGSDDVSYNNNSTFDTKNVGNNKTITCNFVLTGTDSSNYSITQPTNPTSPYVYTASITVKQLTLSAEKTYDGSNVLGNCVTFNGMISGEQLNYTATSLYTNVSDNANNYINSIVLSNYTSGANTYLASNYELPTLNITNAPVTINKRQLRLRAKKFNDNNLSLNGAIRFGNLVEGELLLYTDATANTYLITDTQNFVKTITLLDGTEGLANNYQLPTLSYNITNNNVHYIEQSSSHSPSLPNMDFCGVDLSNSVEFSNAILVNSNLSNITMNESTDLFNALLSGVKSGGIKGSIGLIPMNWTLINGYLIGPGANLTGANLTGVNLSFMKLHNVDFTGANLTNVKFNKTHLTNVTFSGAILNGVDFTGSFIENCKFNDVSINSTTYFASNTNNMSIYKNAMMLNIMSKNINSDTNNPFVSENLPKGWKFLNKYFVGPGAILYNSDFSNNQ